jgi:hypothetical protein
MNVRRNRPAIPACKPHGGQGIPQRLFNAVRGRLAAEHRRDGEYGQRQQTFYVDALRKPLGPPSEELIVAQALVDDLYQAYAEVFRLLQAGDTNGLQSAVDAAAVQYQQFLDNALLIRNLHQFSGLNVICH